MAETLDEFQSKINGIHGGRLLAVALPFPDSTFSPNARVHYKPAARKRAAARLEAAWAAKAALGLSHPWVKDPPRGPIRVRLFWIPKARHRYDRDNLLARMKPYLDGIADALGVDDRLFRFPEPILQDPGRPARTLALLYEAWAFDGVAP